MMRSILACINFICFTTFALAQQAAKKQIITVAQQGTANYKTIGEAIQAVPKGNTTPVEIHIKPGRYYEKLNIDATQQFISFIGDDSATTIITYNDHSGQINAAGKRIDTRTSYTIKIDANNFKAKNICFVNDAGFNAGQAVAVEINGDKAIFDHCSFLGFQDVLFTNEHTSRQYFYKCTIQGTTDFIFGASTAWFEKCHIHSLKNSHITAASTPQQQQFGYVFNNCIITANDTLKAVSLGRPWQPYAAVIFMRSKLPPQLKNEGWSNWNNTENFKTARYAEYRNYGAGALPLARVPWSKQLLKKEAKSITQNIVFNNWQPQL